MSPEVIDCLVNEMKVSWEHLEAKYSSFSTEIQSLIDSELIEMLEVSRSIKTGNATADDFKTLFYEDGDELTNEFLQAMFDCLKQWQSYEGIQLQKNLYEHTNRNTDYWFPLVKIEEQINECTYDDKFITVYRGCNEDEFPKGDFKQRQSWTTDIDVAKTFAFHHASGPLVHRIVIQASINKKYVLWDKGGVENEMVLRLGFEPESSNVVMTYDSLSMKIHNE